MRLKIARALAPVACVALVACHVPGMKSNKAPTGQVVATVDGDEITLSELKAEMQGGPQGTTPQAAKALEEAALRQIIIRKIMANAAHDQGLDKTPAFAIEKQRAGQALLTQALQRQLAASVSPPAREDAETFIAAHPEMFANRKLITLDQLRMQRPKTPEALKAFMPLHNLADFETLAAQQGLKFQRTATVLDTAATAPQMVDQIEKLPSGEPFLYPQQGMIMVNVVRDARPSPFTGDVAVEYAMGVLRSQKAQEQVGKGLENLIKSKEGTVKYNDAYKPTQPLVPATKPPAPAAAPAAGPAPAAAPAASPAKP